MAEVMDSYIVEPGALPDAPPRVLEIGEVRARLAACYHPGIVVVAGQGGQQPHRRGCQWHRSPASLGVGNPRRRLQRFLGPAPSFTPPHFQGVSSRDVRCLESRLVCCLIQITIQLCRTRQLTCQCQPVTMRAVPSHDQAVEIATLEWVDWFNNRRLLEPIGNIPPAEAEERHYAMLEQSDMAA